VLTKQHPDKIESKKPDPKKRRRAMTYFNTLLTTTMLK
jgi:hypothetical protein